MATVQKIIRDYLVQNKFDGLISKGCDGCDIGSLMPCLVADLLDCEPAYKIACDCDEKCDWHMSPTRPRR